MLRGLVERTCFPAIALRVRRAAPGLLCLLVAAGGCVEVEQQLIVHGDGSVSCSLTYVVSERQLPTLAGAQALVQGWQGVPTSSTAPDSLAWWLNESLAAEYFGVHGVALESYTNHTVGDRRRVRLSCRAEDGLSALRSGVFGDYSVSRVEGGAMLIRANLARSPAGSVLSPAGAACLRELCQGLRLQLEIVVPFGLQSSTAPAGDGRSAVWRFDLSEDGPGSLLAGPPEVAVVFDGRDMPWQPESTADR